MQHPQNASITQLLVAGTRGQRAAPERLRPACDRELHRLAGTYVSQEGSLEVATLLNEAYLRLVDCSRVEWRGRTYFMAVCAPLLRRILVDYARASGKRTGDAASISLDAGRDIQPLNGRELLALDRALGALAASDERRARVVELRLFGGLNTRETAEALGVSEDTVLREWKPARAWLLRKLRRKPGREA